MRSRLFVKASFALVLILVASPAVRAADPAPSERDGLSTSAIGVGQSEHAIDIHRYQSPAEGCVDSSCLFSGDVDGNGIPGELDDLAFLAAFIYGGGPAPDPYYEGNANGDCGINQWDVDYFACALFGGAGCTGTEYFPHPGPCECNLSCCWDRKGSILLYNGSSNYCTDYDDRIVDIADLTNLIDHLFVSFATLCCPDGADFAPLMYGEPQDGAIDVQDLTGLIDHLFINFTELPCCY